MKFAFLTLCRVALDKNSYEFIISIDKKLSYNRKTLFFIVLKMMIWWIHQIQIKAMNKWQRKENKLRRMTSNTEHMFHFSNNHRHNSNHSHDCWHKIESNIKFQLINVERAKQNGLRVVDGAELKKETRFKNLLNAHLYLISRSNFCVSSSICWHVCSVVFFTIVYFMG